MPRPATESYLGLLGPVIRAEVGDTIRVSFRNNCSFPTSMHPHGVFYTKSSEGAPYDDGTSGADKADDAVPTGGSHTYIWQVPERAGPGPSDGSSVMWMYHSHTDEVGDTYAGLMGPMVVTGRGMARPDGSPKDVDGEIFEMYSVMNENNSPLLEASEHEFETPYQAPDPADEGFEESNLMHSINGYVFGNQPMVNIKRGQHVRWYVMSMGTEVDLHTPHWHGNDVTVGGMRMDVVDLLPASMVVADMVPDNPGTYLFHCHVNDHITAGMLTRYNVTNVVADPDPGGPPRRGQIGGAGGKRRASGRSRPDARRCAAQRLMLNLCRSGSSAPMGASTPAPTARSVRPISNPGTPSDSTREPKGSDLVTVAWITSPTACRATKVVHAASGCPGCGRAVCGSSRVMVDHLRSVYDIAVRSRDVGGGGPRARPRINDLSDSQSVHGQGPVR